MGRKHLSGLEKKMIINPTKAMTLLKKGVDELPIQDDEIEEDEETTCQSKPITIMSILKNIWKWLTSFFVVLFFCGSVSGQGFYVDTLTGPYYGDPGFTFPIMEKSELDTIEVEAKWIKPLLDLLSASVTNGNHPNAMREARAERKRDKNVRDRVKITEEIEKKRKKGEIPNWVADIALADLWKRGENIIKTKRALGK